MVLSPTNLGNRGRFEPAKKAGSPAAMRELRDQRQEQPERAARRAKSCPRYHSMKTQPRAGFFVPRIDSIPDVTGEGQNRIGHKCLFADFVRTWCDFKRI